ncbi:MAG: hypothetical protein M0030_18775 [Actinomycetota bacterium]|nr:hypothetical protein [Actinomycetota bacterium]
MSAPAPGTAPGVVRVRLSGAPADVNAVARLLAHLAAGLDPCGRQPCLPALALIETSAPYPNRRDPGVRVYLTLAARPADTSHPRTGPKSVPRPLPPAKEHLS